jgi:pimeloyl-ACP methyl ester carboxylesterase
MQFSCGKLAVPLDYSKPTGTTISLFVVKVHSTKQRVADRVGSLLVNPGGPGASGINLAAGLVDELSDQIFDHFDLVGFDPRGVGLSTPLNCISDRQKDQILALDPDVRTPAGRVWHAAVPMRSPAAAWPNTEPLLRITTPKKPRTTWTWFVKPSVTAN